MRNLLIGVVLFLGCNVDSLPAGAPSTSPAPAEVRSCVPPGAPECRADRDCCVGTCWKKAPPGQPLVFGECCLDIGMPCDRGDAPPCCGGLACTAGKCALL